MYDNITYYILISELYYLIIITLEEPMAVVAVVAVVVAVAEAGLWLWLWLWLWL